MNDYRELFLKSQGQLADIIDMLDTMSENLKNFMLECEDDVSIPDEE
jgi:hypothetical protein